MGITNSLQTIFETLQENFQHKNRLFLLGLGLLLALSIDGPIILLNRVVSNQIAGNLTLSDLFLDFDAFRDSLIRFLIQFPSYQNTLITYTLIFSLILILTWIITTIGQGALIDLITLDAKISTQPRSHWMRGRAALWRLVLLDALIFLPVFLIMLTALMVINAGLFFAIQSSQTLTLETIQSALLTLGLCLAPLICFVLPLTFISLVYRLVAFRLVVINDLKTWEAIKHTTPILRGQLGYWVLMMLVSAALWGLFGSLNRLSDIALFIAPDNLVGQLIQAAAIIWELFVGTGKYIVISALWTVGVRLYLEKNTLSAGSS